MDHLWFALYLIFVSAAFALLEVQIEGRQGWARGLPTWRIENRITRALLGNRPVTGYHFYIHVFIFSISQLPFALQLAPLSLKAEARVLSFLILFWILEDFLWFVFNPDYGIRSFRKERVWWHAGTWWGIMPRDYWIFAPLGLVLYYFSALK